MPKYTKKYFECADELESFVRSNRDLLEAYLMELHKIEMRILGQQQAIQREFEDAAGITSRIKSDGDDPAPPDLVLSGNIYEDYEATQRRLSGEFKREADGVRQSERFKKKLDIWDVLRGQFHAELIKCKTIDDHPLVRAAKEPEPAWMVQLDERNFDEASATTLEDKERIRKNKEQLANDEINEARAKENRISKTKPSQFVIERAKEDNNG